MSTITTLLFQAQVADCEQKGIVAGAEQFLFCLGPASGDNAWRVQLKFSAPDRLLVPVPGVSAIILSLLPDAKRVDEPIAVTEARWRALLPALLASGAPIFLRTVFRHVRERIRDGRSHPLLERIRRLNRMAADLSHAYGLAVIDIDRAFAHIGGQPLETDWRLYGVPAAEVAGHTMAWSMLSFGLDSIIDPVMQEHARQKLGPLGEINSLLQRRLTQGHAAGTPD